MNKNLAVWGTVGIVIVVAVAVVFILFRPSSPPAYSPGAQGDIEKNLKETIEQAAQLPTVEVPSADPLDAALPDVNPVQKANPFTVQNPFK